MPVLKLEPAFGRYCTIGAVLLCSVLGLASKASAQQKWNLREQYKTGESYEVITSTEQTGVLDTVTDAKQANLPKRLSRIGKAKSQYVEKVLSVDANQQANKTLRKYLLWEAEQKVGNESSQARLRPQLQHVVLDRQGTQAVTFSPEGPMLLGELEQARTDIFLPRLVGFFPSQAVAVKESWKVSNQAIQELTDLQQIQSGSLECTLSQVESLNGRETCLVKFFGQVSGTTLNGTNQQTIQGHYSFDLKIQRLVALQFEVTSVLFDRQQKQAGDITARYKLTRQHLNSQDVSTAGMTLEPTEENTLLLVQEPRLGLELVHSRRWVPRPVNDKSWVIDGPSGSGITLQFEPANTIPQADAIRKQIEATLGKSAQNLKPLPDPAGWAGVERMSWSGIQNGKDFVFEYLLWKQGTKGAIIAGRYYAPEAGMAQKDVERMIRGLKVTP